MSVDTLAHDPLIPSDVAEIIAAAREHAVPVQIDPKTDEIIAFVIPAGAHLEQVDPDDTRLLEPRHLTGHVTLGDVPSFREYVTEFYDQDKTTAWVNATTFRVDALLNDAHRHKHSGPEGDQHDHAAWRDHRATLQLVKTPEWERWRQWDGKLRSQEDFARHIEVSELDITDPSAADLLEIASSFYATTSAEVRSAKRLHSGETQFEWVEETTATAGLRKQLEVPKEFRLAIAPFHGEETRVVRVLLRYRLRDGVLAMGYELVRPDDIERESMDRIAVALRGSIRRVYIGSPALAGR